MINKNDLTNLAHFPPELVKLYGELYIGLGVPVCINTTQGHFIFPTVTERANAWVCAYCQDTPYVNSLESKEESLPEDKVHDLDKQVIPLILFLTPKGSDKPDRSITFHFQCAKELGILDFVKHKKPLEIQDVIGELHE